MEQLGACRQCRLGNAHLCVNTTYPGINFDGGFADLHHPENWDLGFMEHSDLAREYHKIVESIRDALEFMEAVAGGASANMRRVDFFTSHEGLHLPYEQAQTRRVPHREGWYNLSTHLPWR